MVCGGVGVSRVTVGLFAALAVLLLVCTGSAVATDTTAVVAQQNNTTIQHENPDQVNDDGDQDDIQQWLQGRMGDLLQQSAIQISDGEYETAQSVLGEQYNDYLSKYVDVAGDTAGQDESTAAQALNETRAEQQAYAATLEEYRSTYDAYQDAKAAGNETRAQQLARELVRLADQLTATSTDVTNSYETIGNTTGANGSNPINQIGAITANVTNQQQAVVDAEFIPTQLSVRNVSPTGSYTSPIQIHGTLHANQSLPSQIRIQVGAVNHTVAVGSNGEFVVSYRPVSERTGEQTLSVAYQPASTSIFRGANATATTQITAVRPTLSVTTNQTTTQYHERVSIQGRVTVNGTGVAGVPLDLALADRVRTTVETNATGAYTATIVVPAGVPVGDVTVTAAVGFRDRAIAATSAHTPITVEETTPKLSATATRNQTQTQIVGRLTAAGMGVSGQRVRVLQNGTELTTAPTNATGGYQVAIPQSIAAPGSDLQVVFSGENSNLVRATAQTRVPVTGGGSGGLPIALVGLVGGLVLVLGGGVVWYRHQQVGDTTTTEPGATEDTRTPAEHSTPTEETPRSPSVGLPKTVGSAAAVRQAYAGVRQAVGPFLSSDDVGRTHGEFAQTVQAELDPSVGAAVAELSRVYERAAYAETGVSDDELEAATRAVETVRGWLAEREAFTHESRSDQVNG